MLDLILSRMLRTRTLLVLGLCEVVGALLLTEAAEADCPQPAEPPAAAAIVEAAANK